MNWFWRWHHQHHHRFDRRGPGPWSRGPGGPPPFGPFAGSLGPFGRAVLFRGGPAAFVRARLHRRIFAWFGISILLTCIAVGTLGVMIDRGGNSPHREIERASAFMANQFGKVWDRPLERNALAEEMARDFEVRVELLDASGVPILAAYPDRPPVAKDPCKRPSYHANVVRGGVAMGEVRVCLDPRPAWPRWGGIALCGVVGFILWAASGRIARRLGRPLGDLARVAEELGQGKLDSRVPVGCYEPGEVAVVAEAMNDMASRIQKQLDDQRELLATVSHELRTPLSRIRLLTEIARDGGDPGHAFDEIDREVVEIDQLVAELLASSRLDFSALAKKDVSAKEAAQRAVSRAGLDAGEVVTVVPEGGAPKLSADPTLLARALANLIDNAARHGGGAKKVVVRNGGGRVAFEVEDEGPGLAPGEEERIFEAFYQGTPGGSGPPASANEGGSGDVNGASAAATNGAETGEAQPKKGALGLGLALVRRIAEAHGGRAFAENRTEGGARFVLELPVQAPAAA